MANSLWAAPAPAAYTHLDFQHHLAAHYAHAFDAVGAQQGVAFGCAAQGVGTALTWTVGIGGGHIAGPASQTGCDFWIDATPVTHEARDASYARIDLVGIAANFATGTVTVVVTKGIPSASPAAPAQPAAPYLPLYRVTVPAGAGALAAQDVRPRTAALGAPLPCTSSSRPTSSAVLYPGYQIYETDTRKVFVWDGGRWAGVGENEPGWWFSRDPNVYEVARKAQVRDGSATLQLRVRFGIHFPANVPIGIVSGLPISSALGEPGGVWVREGTGDAGQVCLAGDGRIWLKGVTTVPQGSTFTITISWCY